MNELKTWIVPQDFQASRFQAFIVKAVEIVNPNNLVARLQKPLCDVESNKSGASSEQYPFHTETSLLQIRQNRNG
jgi:hypothetical protein